MFLFDALAGLFMCSSNWSHVIVLGAASRFNLVQLLQMYMMRTF